MMEDYSSTHLLKPEILLLTTVKTELENNYMM